MSSVGDPRQLAVSGCLCLSLIRFNFLRFSLTAQVRRQAGQATGIPAGHRRLVHGVSSGRGEAEGGAEGPPLLPLTFIFFIRFIKFTRKQCLRCAVLPAARRSYLCLAAHLSCTPRLLHVLEASIFDQTRTAKVLRTFILTLRLSFLTTSGLNILGFPTLDLLTRTP